MLPMLERKLERERRTRRRSKYKVLTRVRYNSACKLIHRHTKLFFLLLILSIVYYFSEIGIGGMLNLEPKSSAWVNEGQCDQKK